MKLTNFCVSLMTDDNEVKLFYYTEFQKAVNLSGMFCVNAVQTCTVLEVSQKCYFKTKIRCEERPANEQQLMGAVTFYSFDILQQFIEETPRKGCSGCQICVLVIFLASHVISFSFDIAKAVHKKCTISGFGLPSHPPPEHPSLTTREKSILNEKLLLQPITHLA